MLTQCYYGDHFEKVYRHVARIKGTRDTREIVFGISKMKIPYERRSVDGRMI
jgi:hypothetical protein